MLALIALVVALAAGPASGSSEVQAISLELTSAPDSPSGVFRLLWTTYPTAYLGWNASALAVQAALEDLHDDLAVTAVTRYSSATGLEWRVTFADDTDVEELVPQALVSDAAITVSTLVEGAPNSDCFDVAAACVASRAADAACGDMLTEPAAACCPWYPDAVDCMVRSNCTTSALAEAMVECHHLGCGDCGSFSSSERAANNATVALTLAWGVDAAVAPVYVHDVTVDGALALGLTNDSFPFQLNDTAEWEVAFSSNASVQLYVRLSHALEASKTQLLLHAEMPLAGAPSVSVALVNEEDQTRPLQGALLLELSSDDDAAVRAELGLGMAPLAGGEACDVRDGYDPDCANAWCAADLTCGQRPDGLAPDGEACRQPGAYDPACASSWCGAEGVCSDGTAELAPRRANGANCSVEDAEPLGRYDAECASSWCAVDGRCADAAGRLADGEPCFVDYDYDPTCVGGWCSRYYLCMARTDGREPDYSPCDHPTRVDKSCASLYCDPGGYCLGR